jgi:RNase P subunit RPR2
MGKKRDSVDPTHERLNFLHQLALHMANRGSLASGTSGSVTGLDTLSRFYGYTLRGLANKTVTRLSPQVKAHYCRRCMRVLLGGHGALVLLRKGRGRFIVTRCTGCGFQKRVVVSKYRKVVRGCGDTVT